MSDSLEIHMAANYDISVEGARDTDTGERFVAVRIAEGDDERVYLMPAREAREIAAAGQTRH